MAHLLNIIKRKGASQERTEEEEDPGATDTIPQERHREEDLVSAFQKYLLQLFLGELDIFLQILEMMLNR